MKRRTQLLIFPIFFFLLTHLTNAAEERLSFHAGVGMAFPAEKTIHSALETGFGFCMRLNRSLAVSLDFSYWKSNVKEKQGKLFSGELAVSPFSLSLHCTIFPQRALTPYLSCGAGFIFTNFKLGEYFSIPEVTISQKVKNGLSAHAGGGIRLRVANRLGLFSEITYILRKTSGETTINDMNFGRSSENFSVDMSTALLKLGISYSF